MFSQPQKILTPAEYLARERQADVKSEYFAGEVFAMAGASRRHNLILANIIRVLGNQLLERPCNVYPSDMRVKITELGKYTYPDVAVVRGEEIFEDEHNDTLLNPQVIIEVLSESTEAYDRGKNLNIISVSIHWLNICSSLKILTGLNAMSVTMTGHGRTQNFTISKTRYTSPASIAHFLSTMYMPSFQNLCRQTSKRGHQHGRSTQQPFLGKQIPR
jgi:hypothetical protein